MHPLLQALTAHLAARRTPGERAGAVLGATLGLGSLGAILAVGAVFLRVRLRSPFASEDWQVMATPAATIASDALSGTTDTLRPVPALLLRASYALFGADPRPYAALVAATHVAAALLTALAMRALGIGGPAPFLASAAVLFTDASAVTDMCLLYNQAAFAKLFAAVALLALLRRPRPVADVWLPASLVGALCNEQFFAVGAVLAAALGYRDGARDAVRSITRGRHLPFAVTLGALFAARIWWHLTFARSGTAVPGSGHPLSLAGVGVNLDALARRTAVLLDLRAFARPLDAPRVRALLALAAVAFAAAWGEWRALARVALLGGLWWLACVLPNLATTAMTNDYNLLLALHGPFTAVLCLAFGTRDPAWSLAPRPSVLGWSRVLVGAGMLRLLLVPDHARFFSNPDLERSNPATVIPRAARSALARSAADRVVRALLVDVDEDPATAAPPMEGLRIWMVELTAGDPTRNACFAASFPGRLSELRAAQIALAPWRCVRRGDFGMVVRHPSHDARWREGWFATFRYEPLPPCDPARLPAELSRDPALDAARAATYWRAYTAGDDDRAEETGLALLRDHAALAAAGRPRSPAHRAFVDWVWATLPTRRAATPPFAPVRLVGEEVQAHVYWIAGPGPSTATSRP